MNYYNIAFYDRLMELATGNYVSIYNYHEFLLYDDAGNVKYDDYGRLEINPAIEKIIQFMPHLFDHPLSST
ncbi:MAG: hypothetical protein ACTSYI_08660 [Promethearchaeota archaeon]